jgi:hypothetical protein
MRRTQLYLDDQQHQQATRLAAESGLTLSDIVRVALDEYLQRRRRQRKEFLDALQSASGVWRNRNDLPDLAEARRHSERIGPWLSEH